MTGAMIRLLVILTVLLGLATPAASETSIRLAQGARGETAVGRIITPKGPICTGVLIGPYTVLTAAHCLTTRAGDGYFSPGLIHFALYPPQGGQLYAKSAETHINPAYTLPVGTHPDQLRQDWAVLVLEDPLGETVRPATLLTAAQFGQAEGWPLKVVAYGMARTLRPTVHAQTCRLLERDSDLIRHSCRVQPGSSGSVLLATHQGETFAAAVNVAARLTGAGQTSAALLPDSVAELSALKPQSPDRFVSPFERSGSASWNR